MRIVNIIGGLGNQLFQYAFARCLQKRFPNEEVLLDTSHYGSIFFHKYRGRNLHNGYEISRIFPNASLKIATQQQLRRVTRYIPNYVVSRAARRWLKALPTEIVQPNKNAFLYDSSVFEYCGDKYYEGYWHAIPYFEDVRDELTIEFAHGEPNEYNKRMIARMISSNSVGIHVRRGDYINNPLVDGICTAEYYEKAVNCIIDDNQSHTFFLFSNDLPWCENNIVPLLHGAPYIIVSENRGNDSTWDMFLMTYCKDLIIANSTFSWWGAFLNHQEGRIIAPRPWIRERGDCNMYMKHWIVIDTQTR